MRGVEMPNHMKRIASMVVNGTWKDRRATVNTELEFTVIINYVQAWLYSPVWKVGRNMDIKKYKELIVTHSSWRVLAPNEEIQNKADCKYNSWVQGGCLYGNILNASTIWDN